MLFVVSESASEGMLFSALCALLRFHTAKTQERRAHDRGTLKSLKYMLVFVKPEAC